MMWKSPTKPWFKRVFNMRGKGFNKCCFGEIDEVEVEDPEKM